MPSRSHRVFIETNHSGSPHLFVRSRSPYSPRHHHGSHHHRSRSEERISRDELFDVMQERERTLREAYDNVWAENQLLKGQIHTKHKEADQQRAFAQQVQRRDEELLRENAELHRKLEALQNKQVILEDDNKRLRHKNSKLKNDNEQLKADARREGLRAQDADDRARILAASNASLKDEATQWRRRYEDGERRLTILRENANEYITENSKLKDQVQRLIDLTERRRSRTTRLDY